jgi:hypothetical protein
VPTPLVQLRRADREHRAPVVLRRVPDGQLAESVRGGHNVGQFAVATAEEVVFRQVVGVRVDVVPGNGFDLHMLITN